MAEDFYGTLGVSREASQADLAGIGDAERF